MREDHYSNTVEDAGAWERERGMAEDVDYDRPTAAEAEADLYHAGPENVIGYGVRCAHCRNRHATVADVRWCSDLHAEAKAEALAETEADRAFARDREAIAERGTWFGPVTEADSWGEDEDVPPATTTINHGNTGACEGGACSWHDKCRKHRAQDVANGDRLGNFRAYND
jgi:hypothetical protein